MVEILREIHTNGLWRIYNVGCNDIGSEKKQKKICELVITREELLEALRNIECK